MPSELLDKKIVLIPFADSFITNRIFFYMQYLQLYLQCLYNVYTSVYENVYTLFFYMQYLQLYLQCLYNKLINILIRFFPLSLSHRFSVRYHKRKIDHSNFLLIIIFFSGLPVIFYANCVEITMLFKRLCM